LAVGRLKRGCLSGSGIVSTRAGVGVGIPGERAFNSASGGEGDALVAVP
jgi:hypothetical protein